MQAAFAKLFSAFVFVLGSAFSSLADERGDFDFYVLSLSWSPTYCKQEGERANKHQCEVRKPFRFIVHGLWPQYERGYPENCPGAPRRIDRQIAVSMEDIMPSHNLVFHQWRKHGSCSGLSPRAYFALTRQAFKKIQIPRAFQTLDKRAIGQPALIEKAFLLANKKLTADGLAVSCDRGELEDVRICLTKDLKFRSCRQVDRSGCRASRLSIPAPGTR